MIHLILCLAVLATIVASAILIVWRPVKLLAKIQIILTVLIFVAFVINIKIALWLHSTAYNDPARQQWRPMLDVIWFGTMIPWFLFTIYHVIVVMRQKLRPKEEV
jgi:amino acid transporter